jgi:hypothetical protein
MAKALTLRYAQTVRSFFANAGENAATSSWNSLSAKIRKLNTRETYAIAYAQFLLWRERDVLHLRATTNHRAAPVHRKHHYCQQYFLAAGNSVLTSTLSPHLATQIPDRRCSDGPVTWIRGRTKLYDCRSDKVLIEDIQRLRCKAAAPQNPDGHAVKVPIRLFDFRKPHIIVMTVTNEHVWF